MTLGEYIRNYRRSRAMSLRAFAERAGLSCGYVSMLEKNKHPRTGKPITPSIEIFQRVADATGTTVDAILLKMDGKAVVKITPADPSILSDQKRQKLLDAASQMTPQELEALVQSAEMILSLRKKADPVPLPSSAEATS